MFRADTGLSLEAQGTQGFWARKGSLACKSSREKCLKACLPQLSAQALERHREASLPSKCVCGTEESLQRTQRIGLPAPSPSPQPP